MRMNHGVSALIGLGKTVPVLLESAYSVVVLITIKPEECGHNCIHTRPGEPCSDK